MSTTLEQLLHLVQQELGTTVTPAQTALPFSELGLDSLGLVDFMFTVEDHWGVQIDHDRALAEPTLTGLAALVDELLAAKKAVPAVQPA